VLALAGKGYRQALKDDRWLRDGLNVHQGKDTQQEVAHDLGYDFHEPESLI
jgi:alanine dehydrogenase